MLWFLNFLSVFCQDIKNELIIYWLLQSHRLIFEPFYRYFENRNFPLFLTFYHTFSIDQTLTRDTTKIISQITLSNLITLGWFPRLPSIIQKDYCL